MYSEKDRKKEQRNQSTQLRAEIQTVSLYFFYLRYIRRNEYVSYVVFSMPFMNENSFLFSWESQLFLLIQLTQAAERKTRHVTLRKNDSVYFDVSANAKK